MPNAEMAAPTVENVRVVVRVRPMDQKERLDGAYNCVSVDPVNNTIAVTRSNVSPAEPPRIYAYDAVFDTNTTQYFLGRALSPTLGKQICDTVDGCSGTQEAAGRSLLVASYNTCGKSRGDD
ncbi:jg23220, partial [Pararge aegeria aegeria]